MRACAAAVVKNVDCLVKFNFSSPAQACRRRRRCATIICVSTELAHMWIQIVYHFSSLLHTPLAARVHSAALILIDKWDNNLWRVAPLTLSLSRGGDIIPNWELLKNRPSQASDSDLSFLSLSRPSYSISSSISGYHFLCWFYKNVAIMIITMRVVEL